MTAIIELNDLPTDADPGRGSGGMLKDVKEKTAGGKSTRLTVQFSTEATEGDTERTFRKSESDPGARVESDDGRASISGSVYKRHSSYPDGSGGAAALPGREGPQMSLCQVLLVIYYLYKLAYMHAHV